MCMRAPVYPPSIFTNTNYRLFCRWLDSTQCKNMISRFHATVTYLPESFSWQITDGSVNGIAINDVKRKEAILR